MDLSVSIKEYIQRHKLIKPGETLLVGVSGGSDSVALLYLLDSLKYHLSVSLHIAHFNHQTRKLAYKDEGFVQKLASKLQIPITVGRRLNKKIISNKISEDKARRFRYGFFTKLAKKKNITTIALAHTEDDLAETVLMRIIRGTGLLGLQGIAPQRTQSGIKFIRPLLDISKNDLLNFLKKRKIPFCEDETNTSRQFLRNRIRLELLPLLSKNYNSSVVKELSQLAKIVSGDYDFLLNFARQNLKRISQINKAKTKICIAKNEFQTYHLSIQRLMLRLCFEILKGDLNVLEWSHVFEIEKALNAKIISKIIALPKKIKVCLTRNSIIFQVM